jgi:hypothetical protein
MMKEKIEQSSTAFKNALVKEICEMLCGHGVSVKDATDILDSAKSTIASVSKCNIDLKGSYWDQEK